MRAIVISDLHLTDLPRDEYRWRVFDQVATISNERGIDKLLILGDLTEFKDYHSSRLVNRIVDKLYQLRRVSRIIDVHILKGNHDGLDSALPYFYFLRRIPWAHFYAEPTRVDLRAASILYLPHTRDPETDWKDLEFDTEYIFFHGTITGAVAETGQALEGIPAAVFTGLRSIILGGDVHVPQKVGGAEYVGAPYHIRFGDAFVPRAIVLEGRKIITVELSNVRKLTIKASSATHDDFDQIRPGDHVRVVICLHDSELGEFHGIKQAVAQEVELHGGVLIKVQLEKLDTKKPRVVCESNPPSSATNWVRNAFDTYCERNRVDTTLTDLGAALLEDK